jgi:hypothetical protein
MLAAVVVFTKSCFTHLKVYHYYVTEDVSMMVHKLKGDLDQLTLASCFVSDVWQVLQDNSAELHFVHRNCWAERLEMVWVRVVWANSDVTLVEVVTVALVRF